MFLHATAIDINFLALSKSKFLLGLCMMKSHEIIRLMALYLYVMDLISCRITSSSVLIEIFDDVHLYNYIYIVYKLLKSYIMYISFNTSFLLNRKKNCNQTISQCSIISLLKDLQQKLQLLSNYGRPDCIDIPFNIFLSDSSLVDSMRT